MGALDLLERRLAELSPKETAALDKLIAEELKKPWLPTPGPQLEAYLSKADLLLYGGAAGGGKTDLLCGLALNEHHETVVFRRQANDLDGFWKRLTRLCKNPVSRNSVKKNLSTADGRSIECGHLDAPGAEEGWMGRPHDLIAIDEGAQLSAFKVKFVMGWLRSAAGHRCRAIIASNPPLGGEGAWLIEWFAPWLDPLYPRPAAPGELRYGVTIGSENELKTIWTDGPELIFVNKDGTWRLATEAEATHNPPLNEVGKPLSRTFIPARLDDNPYLRDTDYRAQLNSMPEPLRSQLLFGDFLAGRQDDEWQVIPSAWVRAAQARWVKPTGKRMRALGVDVAQGGNDKTVIVPLYEPAIFGAVLSWEGSQTPDGPSVANLILKERRDGAAIAIDMTGGWGGSARDHLATNHQVKVFPIVYSAAGAGLDPQTNLGYANMRAKLHWEFRLALDPAKTGSPNHEDVALPPGDRVFAQLTAARWKPRSGKILVESKEEIRERLGSSTDESDAIIEAWFVRHQSYKAQARPASNGDQIPRARGWMGT